MKPAGPWADAISPQAINIRGERQLTLTPNLLQAGRGAPMELALDGAVRAVFH